MKKLNKNFKPGSLGFHELLDRSYLAAEFFSENVGLHMAAQHPKLRKKIRRIEDKLYDLYQRIGNQIPYDAEDTDV